MEISRDIASLIIIKKCYMLLLAYFAIRLLMHCFNEFRIICKYR